MVSMLFCCSDITDVDSRFIHQFLKSPSFSCGKYIGKCTEEYVKTNKKTILKCYEFTLSLIYLEYVPHSPSYLKTMMFIKSALTNKYGTMTDHVDKIFDDGFDIKKSKFSRYVDTDEWIEHQ